MTVPHCYESQVAVSEHAQVELSYSHNYHPYDVAAAHACGLHKWSGKKLILKSLTVDASEVWPGEAAGPMIRSDNAADIAYYFHNL